jgi:LPS sulfotransferase NodH
MRLPRPFHRLKVQFDPVRLQQEIAGIPDDAWAPHPNGIPGNSSIRLISVGGGDNDDVNGSMAMTLYLEGAPYIRQVLSSFGVVWGRTRLMRLAAGASVTPHADINYHWFRRVRLHIPIITWPEVRFYCGDEVVHMAAGEAWLFDNWRQHRVENPTGFDRIHLVADTSGGSSFWHFVAKSQLADTPDVVHRYNEQQDAAPLTEQTVKPPVMPPAELELLILDLDSELATLENTPAALNRLAQYRALLDNFCKDWRQIYALHGEREAGRADFLAMRDNMRDASKKLAQDILVARTNRVNAHVVLDARVLRPMVVPAAMMERPVFIIAAPRSGSTLLYETLAAHEALCTLGGEAHWLVESISELQLGSPRVASNRLDAGHANEAIRSEILKRIAEKLVDSRGQPITTAVRRRMLEKTPKNALRIPFFNRLFPDAIFIFLWREPVGNLSSIIEAWRSGNWKTYNGLRGFDGPWSLILPPGWASMNGKSLEEIAAFQWQTTNQIAMADLESLPRERWCVVNYQELLDDPTAAVLRLCERIGIEADDSLRRRLGSSLPFSRYTQTPPTADKWRKNAQLIGRVMPDLENTWRRLRELR